MRVCAFVCKSYMYMAFVVFALFFAGGMDQTVKLWDFSKILEDAAEADTVPGL